MRLALPRRSVARAALLLLLLSASPLPAHAAAIPPPDSLARQALESSPRHGEFVDVPYAGQVPLRSYVVYPERKDKAGVQTDLERVFGYFPRLKERVQQQAGTLSGGEQQMLAIARALMLKPRLMLLDEPSFGLAPLIVVEIFRIMRRINEEEGVSMLLVEQNAALALDLADHAYVLETGRVVMSGPIDEVRATPQDTLEQLFVAHAAPGGAR